MHRPPAIYAVNINVAYKHSGHVMVKLRSLKHGCRIEILNILPYPPYRVKTRRDALSVPRKLVPFPPFAIGVIRSPKGLAFNFARFEICLCISGEKKGLRSFDRKKNDQKKWEADFFACIWHQMIVTRH